jgi:hypothetical protein
LYIAAEHSGILSGERHEACVWLVADLTVEETRQALAAAMPDFERYLASRQMLILHYAELYTNPDGSVKPADTLRDELVELGAKVRDNGFNGLLHVRQRQLGR